MRIPITLLVLGAGLWGRTVSTTCTGTESPLSEGGIWTNGSTASASWGNVQKGSSTCYGVSQPTTFGDPTAIVDGGSWGGNQTVTATAKINTPPTVCCHEVEARVLTTISANSITGYEGLCSTVAASKYCQLVRWNGPVGNFTQLDQIAPTNEIRNGDVMVFSVTQSGGTKTFQLSINGVLQTWTNTGTTSTTDSGGSSFSSGSPGMGFYDNQDSNWSFFGWSAWSATDGLASTSGVASNGPVNRGGNTTSK